MTFAQARVEATRALRSVRQIYRHADTSGEVLERSLDRLIEKRKRIVTSAQLLPVIERWREYQARVKDMEDSLLIASRLLAGLEL